MFYFLNYFSSILSTVSTGVRFTTLPEASNPLRTSAHSIASQGPPSQPPTTITALFNPMMGHVSGAYTARVSRDLSLSSRFDFNVYSYDSEWTIGAEWWMRRSKMKVAFMPSMDEPPISSPPVIMNTGFDDVDGVVKAKVSTNNVSFFSSVVYIIAQFLKDVSLMWEGRLKNMLVSLGVVSDFSSPSKPIKAIGLELSYFSSA